MSAAAAGWLRVAVATATALALLLALAPPRPPERLPWLLQPPAGLLAGGVLYLVASGCRPRRATGPVSWPALAARIGLLGLLAAGEEIVWRRVALGELLFAGAVAALAASTVAFALAHRARPGLHVLTGATFGGVYLATGGLTASIAAHWTYNVLVGTLASFRPGPDGARP